MSSRPTLRHAANGLLILSVLLIGYQLVTGSTRLVVASGASMEPLVEADDLIVIRPQAEYSVGDVVAYRNESLDTILHRIVDERFEDGERRFVLQGDNNAFRDAEEPVESAVLGTAGLIVPNGGRVLSLLPLAAAALLVFYWVFASNEEAVPTVTGSTAKPGQVVGWGLILSAGLVGVLAVTQPTIETYDRQLTHETGKELQWSATVQPSLVYPNGTLRAGDPVFLSEIDVLEFSATVAVDEMVTSASGSLVISAVVSDDSGWSRQIEIASGSIGAESADATGTLDLAELRTQLEQIADQTGLHLSKCDVLIEVRSEHTGSIEGEAFEKNAVLQVPMVLDEVMLAADPDASWTATTPATVTVQDQRPARLSVAGVALPVNSLRTGAALTLLVGLVLAFWPRRRMAPHELINQHFGSLVVSVERTEIPAGVASVTVDSFSDLLRLAQIESAPILHVEGDDHEWVTSAMGVWYRFVLVDAAAAAAEGVDGDPGEPATSSGVEVVTAADEASTVPDWLSSAERP